MQKADGQGNGMVGEKGAAGLQKDGSGLLPSPDISFAEDLDTDMTDFSQEPQPRDFADISGKSRDCCLEKGFDF